MKHKSIIKLTTAVLALSMLTISLVGCGNSQGASSETADSKYTHRVILVSDMHYTTNMEYNEYNKANSGSNASTAAGPIFGISQQDKAQSIVDDINSFAEKNPIEAVFVLGDMSLDDYGFRNLKDSFLKEFKDICLEKLNYPYYTVAGNHDSYPTDEWKKIMKTERQYSVKVGDAVFIMLDTFEDTSATSASGSNYVGVDVKFLKAELEKYPTETIFLGAHYYKPGQTDFAFKKLLKDNPRVVCMFRGHTHLNGVYAAEEMNYKFLFDIGGYGYQSDLSSGTYDWDVFDDDYAWGYQVLEWNETEAHSYHVKTKRVYNGSNGVFDFVGAIEDEQTIPIEKGETEK